MGFFSDTGFAFYCQFSLVSCSITSILHTIWHLSSNNKAQKYVYATSEEKLTTLNLNLYLFTINVTS